MHRRWHPPRWLLIAGGIAVLVALKKMLRRKRARRGQDERPLAQEASR